MAQTEDVNVVDGAAAWKLLAEAQARAKSWRHDADRFGTMGRPWLERGRPAIAIGAQEEERDSTMPANQPVLVSDGFTSCQ